MPTYNMQNFILDIPEGLKDRTIHLFALNDTGPSDFSFVSSRTLVDASETIEFVVDRLTYEMRKTLSGFELKARRSLQIDRQPASELAYTWRSNDILLYQRQTVVLVDSNEGPGVCHAVSFIGTCPKAFTAEWTHKYDKIIGSIRLRSAVSLSSSLSPSLGIQPITAASQGPFFMYSAHDGKLNQFPHAQSLYEFCAYNAVSPELFLFFGPAGQPMVMDTPPPGSESGWVHPESGQALLLWTIDPDHVPTLLSLLPTVRHLVGLGNLRNVDCIAAYLHSLEK